MPADGTFNDVCNTFRAWQAMPLHSFSHVKGGTVEFDRTPFSVSARRPDKSATAQNMNVQMRHALPAIAADVCHQPKTIRAQFVS